MPSLPERLPEGVVQRLPEGVAQRLPDRIPELRTKRTGDDPLPVPDYVRQLAWWLDDAIPLPFGKRRVGIDGLLSMVPGIGDATGFALSAVVVLAGVRAGVSWPTVVRMALYATLESLAGMIPLLGPVIGFAWKANDRNLRLIERDLADGRGTRRSSVQVLIAAVVMAVLFAAILAVGLVLVIWGLWSLLTSWF